MANQSFTNDILQAKKFLIIHKMSDNQNQQSCTSTLQTSHPNKHYIEIIWSKSKNISASLYAKCRKQDVLSLKKNVHKLLFKALYTSKLAVPCFYCCTSNYLNTMCCVKGSGAEWEFGRWNVQFVWDIPSRKKDRGTIWNCKFFQNTIYNNCYFIFIKLMEFIN